jgi:hypothetical protein
MKLIFPTEFSKHHMEMHIELPCDQPMRVENTCNGGPKVALWSRIPRISRHTRHASTRWVNCVGQQHLASVQKQHSEGPFSV